MAQETQTPQKTLDQATQENALPAARLTLLGTFLKPGGNEALIRTGSGAIRRVSSGDNIGGAKVMAIEPGILHLARGGRARRLTLPGG